MITLDDEKENHKMPLSVPMYVREAHSIATESGWWDGHPDRPVNLSPDEMLAKLMLITTEVSEAAECVRNGEPLLWFGENQKPEGLLAELADVFIRICDTVGALGESNNFEFAIRAKMEYNRTRSHRHGGKKA